MGRVAIVTGGTRGIGAAISKALTRNGIRVAANYSSNDERAKEFKEDTGIGTYRWDVGDRDACAKGVAEVEEALGPIDILVNNAGITRDSAFHKMDVEAWNDVIRVNLTGCFNMASLVFGPMRQRQWGRIVNISSINGQTGQFGQVNYSAAKAGLIGFTKALAQEGARIGVTVNAVAPGYTATEMVEAVPPEALGKIISKIPVGRLGEAREIANGVTFLCSEEAGFVTGSVLSINGGQSMY